MKRFSPKAHGAGLGAGTGATIANLVIQTLQVDVLHRTLSQPATTLVYAACTIAVAYFGAWLAPLTSELPPPPAQPVLDLKTLKPIVQWPEAPAAPASQELDVP